MTDVVVSKGTKKSNKDSLHLKSLYEQCSAFIVLPAFHLVSLTVCRYPCSLYYTPFSNGWRDGGHLFIPQFCKNTIHFLFRSNAHTSNTIGDLISSDIFSIGLDDPWLRSSQISTDIARNYIWLRGFYFRFSNFVYARAGLGM